MDTNQTEKLKALALAATPGPWIHDAEDNIIYPAHGGRMIDICCRSTDLGTAQRDNNAAFIAGCNPAAVLELITDRETLLTGCDLAAKRINELEAEVARLRAKAERYEWLRDKSEPGICSFYLSVGQAFKNVKFAPETVDDAIDAARKGTNHA